jgi:hypothetical protein
MDGHLPVALDEKSGVNREVHAPIRGSPGVRFPRATRLNADRRRRDGGNGELAEDERAELGRLRKENAGLAMRCDVLKRSVALWVQDAMGSR